MGGQCDAGVLLVLLAGGGRWVGDNSVGGGVHGSRRAVNG